ncbi:MAG: hypothetical protein IT173_09025 [Acidobacteria bacterium]|nr:hypothetical protein [Acidobacteriota bacterium]
MQLARSILFFVAAGSCEIAGGYLVWIWVRDGKSIWYAALGAVLLVFQKNYEPF